MAKFERINPSYSRTEHPLFRRWTGIRQIILNPNCPDYNPRLRCVGLDDFDEFVEFIEEEIGNPPQPKMLLNRINQNRGWVRGNVRWATGRAVGNNRRTNIKITVKGSTHTPSEWSEITGLHYSCILSRHKLGWPQKDIVTWPSDPGKKHRNA